VGSNGASTGAKIASAITTRKTANPIHDVLLVLNALRVCAAK
jgi:hypothetical protein